MKITVSKEEIQDKLQNIQNIVDKKNTMPILSHFLLDTEEQKAFIYATDLQLAIKEPVEATVQRPGKMCIPAKKLLEIVRELEGDITLDSEDGQWVKGISGKSRFRLACLPSSEFPAWPGIETEEEIVFNSDDLVEIIERTIYSAGEADTRYTLNGLLFHIKPGGVINVVGTDGHRLTLIIKETGHNIKEEKRLIIPRKAASEIGKFVNGVESISFKIGKNHVLFKIAETDFLVRLIEGTYPNYEQVIPRNDKVLKLKREDFLKTLKRVSIMSREKSNAVKMDISDGLLVISSSNPDLGEARDEIGVEYSGDALEIGFNARYIIDSLLAMKGDIVSFALHDQLSPSLLMEEGEENYKCVIMPMRL
ncbi:MAG: DNA polymerase III subunit beta [Thermodesulfovibrionales bacterium]